jgi:hypothetical protein
MYALGAAGQCDIHPIVDDNARPGPSGGPNDITDDSRQLRGFEIGFANLNEVNPRSDGPCRLVDETLPADIEARILRT